MLAHAGRRVRRRQVGGDVGRAAADPLRERAQAVLAAGDEHQPQAVLARQPQRGRLADPARGARDDREPAHDAAIACGGNGARSFSKPRRRLDAVQPGADRAVLARVGAGLVRAVHVGVERDVGHRVLLAADERPLVGEPARQRAERAVPARHQRLRQLRVLRRAAREHEEARDRERGLDLVLLEEHPLVHGRAGEPVVRHQRRARRRGRAGSRPTPGSCARFELEHRHAAVGVAGHVLGRAGLAPEQVDGHRLVTGSRAGAARSGPSCSWRTPGGRRGASRRTLPAATMRG